LARNGETSTPRYDAREAASAYRVRSAVGTLVERKTRFVVLCRMSGCTAQDALEGFTRHLKKLPPFLRESLTYDRGSEMACHVELSERPNIDIWFADPHAPWQRGSNENTNGLLRQFLPKGIERPPNPPNFESPSTKLLSHIFMRFLPGLSWP
jgi:IS30 family transposase